MGRLKKIRLRPFQEKAASKDSGKGEKNQFLQGFFKVPPLGHGLQSKLNPTATKSLVVKVCWEHEVREQIPRQGKLVDTFKNH